MAGLLHSVLFSTFSTFLVLFVSPLTFVDSKYLDPPAEVKGHWDSWEKCPPDTYVHGFSISRNIGNGEFSALRFYCGKIGDKKSSDFFELTIPDHSESKNFTEPIFCERGLAIGVQLLERADAEVQTTSNVALVCSDESLLFDERDGPTGLWSNPNRCNSHEAICATQDEVVTSGSMTILQTLRFDCCEIPHPAQTCSASDTLEQIAECDNNFGAQADLTCSYSKKFGLSYNDNQEEEHSIYENLGFDLASAAPYLAAQPDFDLGQGSSQGQVSFGLETTSEETITAHPGTTVTVKQVVGTCGFYTVRTNFIQIYPDPESVKTVQKSAKKDDFSDVDGMQADFGGWDDEDEHHAEEVDDWSKEEKDEIAVPAATKTESKPEEVETKTVIPEQAKEDDDDEWKSDEDEEEVEVPKTEKPENSETETNDMDDGWDTSDEDQKSEIPEAKTEKPVEPEVVSPKEEKDEDDWGQSEEEAKPENEEPKTDKPVQSELNTEHKEGDDDEWEKSAEDEKSEPEEVTEKPVETKNVDLYAPVTKDEADSWEEDGHDDQTLEIDTPVLAPVSETVQNSESAPVAETPEISNDAAPATHEDEHDDEWPASEEDHTEDIKTPELNEPEVKIPEAAEPENKVTETSEPEIKVPETTEPKVEIADAPKVTDEEEDDWSSEKTEDPAQPELLANQDAAPADPASNVVQATKVDDVPEEVTDQSQGHDLVNDEFNPDEVELLSELPKTEAPLGNLRQAEEEWNQGDNHADADAKTHVEIPIVHDFASPQPDHMANDEAVSDDLDEWGDEDEDEKVNDPEPEVNAVQTAKLNADPEGKRAFDFLQTDSNRNPPPLVDFSALADSTRSLTDQLSPAIGEGQKVIEQVKTEVQKVIEQVQTEGQKVIDEGQKVIDEVKGTPLYQEGQKKVEETVKAVVEAAIKSSADLIEDPAEAESDFGGADGGAGFGGEETTESETEEAFQKAGGFVGYIVGGMVLCVVVIVIVIFIIEKRGNKSTSGHDPINKSEYKANVTPAPEPLISHHAIKITDDTEKYN